MVSDLGVGHAGVVRQLDCLTLHSGEHAQARPDRVGLGPLNDRFGYLVVVDVTVPGASAQISDAVGFLCADLVHGAAMSMS